MRALIGEVAEKLCPGGRPAVYALGQIRRREGGFEHPFGDDGSHRASQLLAQPSGPRQAPFEPCPVRLETPVGGTETFEVGLEAVQDLGRYFVPLAGRSEQIPRLPCRDI